MSAKERVAKLEKQVGATDREAVTIRVDWDGEDRPAEDDEIFIFWDDCEDGVISQKKALSSDEKG